VERLEQIRLTGAVRPDGEYKPGQEIEFESLVRAEVGEPDVLDDQ
jgi:hypothetical protein